MLHGSDAALQQLPGSYLRAALAHLRRPGQGTPDITRRSAGLPYAIVALFLAELGGPRRVQLRGQASSQLHVG